MQIIKRDEETCNTILQARYLAKNEKGEVVETPQELFRRVSSTIAKEDLKYGKTQEEVDALDDTFYHMMSDADFMPNSPTLMNAGRPLGQLSACFVLPIEDSMEGIFDSVKNAAIIHKSGGGTGFSFSRLRAKDAIVKSTGGKSSGPISFMEVFDKTTDSVKQGGCFIGSTLILTSNGPKAIKDIVDGDRLYCYDINPTYTRYTSQIVKSSWMTKSNTQVSKLVVEYTDKDDENKIKEFTIYATPDHPFYTNCYYDITNKSNFTKLKDLQPGNTIFGRLNGLIDSGTVKEIVLDDHTEDVYNVEVPHYHNYIVCDDKGSFGLIVSNTRRGANMGCLRVDHPDILDFITCKDDLNTLNNFNISVAITDKFMSAVINNTSYDLIAPETGKVVKTLDANDVFNKIIHQAWKNGVAQ